MSQITVHPSINHILSRIKDNLTSVDLQDQMNYFEYRTPIVAFIDVILRKLNLDQTLVSLLFDRKHGKEEGGDFLPFKILMIYYSKEDYAEQENDGLRDCLLTCLKLQNKSINADIV